MGRCNYSWSAAGGDGGRRPVGAGDGSRSGAGAHTQVMTVAVPHVCNTLSALLNAVIV